MVFDKPKKKLVVQAEREFGITFDPREAGYILTDGRMLDFSERNQGGPGGMRTLDHRAVERFFTHYKRTEAMRQFERITGALRFYLTADNMVADIYEDIYPTEEQLTTLRRIIAAFRPPSLFIDLYSTEGRSLKQFERDMPMSLAINEMMTEFFG